MGIALAISLDGCVNDGISNSIDVVDNYIPLTEGIPLNTFRWSEGTPIKVRSLLLLHGGSPIDHRYCFDLVVHVYAIAHLAY